MKMKRVSEPQYAIILQSISRQKGINIHRWFTTFVGHLTNELAQFTAGPSMRMMSHTMRVFQCKSQSVRPKSKKQNEHNTHKQINRPTNRQTNNKTHTNNQTLPVETSQTSDCQRKNWRKTYAGGVGRASAAKANLRAKPAPAAECSWNIFGDLFAARSLWHVCRQQQQQQQQRGQRQRQSQRQ